jgi:hypothetical protein
MGFGSDYKIRPSWTLTLGSMIDDYDTVQVWCEHCRRHRKLTREDLVALAEKVGRDYSLWNRRCQCRLTAGCTGWNRFSYRHGCMRNMTDGKFLYRI